jgi:tRNA threonylcarbamoyl adenosine modification protein (Sua5/YciO/YrdC/YwlC family)
MASRILKVDIHAPSATVIQETAAAIQAGGLVVAPTETRYGMLTKADHQDLLEKLYRLKKRALSNPTALLIRDRGRIGEYGQMTDAAEKLARRFLPGPLTLVLGAKQNWPPPRVVDGKIGLRCSSCPVIEGLFEEIDFDLTATSANRSGEGDFDSIEQIHEAFGNEIELYLDAGPLTGPVSTVVDCSGESIQILREGAISTRDIEKAISRGGK